MPDSLLHWLRHPIFLRIGLALCAWSALPSMANNLEVPSDRPLGSGPFPAVMESVPGLPDHTVYRPVNLDAPGLGRMPVVVWGNGACVNVGNRFRWFLTELASHGFLVVAIGPIGPRLAETMEGVKYRGDPAPDSPAGRAGVRRAPNATGGAPGQGLAETSPAQLAHGISWAMDVNARAGSAFAGRIDTSRVAAMGQSCGGLQALALATDPRVTTLGIWNSGALSDETLASRIAGAPISKRTLDAVRVPILYVTGDPSDVAYANAEDDFEKLDGRSVVRVWRERTPHAGTYREPGGGAFSHVAVAWLKWQLKSDATAAGLFKGRDCGLCGQPEWHVKKKGID